MPSDRAGPRLAVAQSIAAVVGDIRAGRVKHHPALDPAIAGMLLDRARAPQPVVDITGMYQSMVERATTVGINFYDDFPTVVSPWDDAVLSYVNKHGNVMVFQVHTNPWQDTDRWETDNHVDWDRVRWLVEASAWIGGFSETTGQPIPTAGPVRLLQHAVYDDGAPADLRWISLAPGGAHADTWEFPTVVLNAALNFLSCSNIEVAEPVRPRAMQKWLRRAGVRVQTIVVRPKGNRSAGGGGEPRPVDELDTPLTSVRGYFAHYGPLYGRGLLFGKYAGKFWVAAHVRGAGEDSEPKDYVLKP